MDTIFCTLKEDSPSAELAADRLGERRTIPAAIARRARAAPDSPALLGTEEPAIMFSQLHACIARCAEQLANAGLGCEDRVGLLVPAGAVMA